MSVTGTGTHLHVLGSLGGGDLLPGEGGDKVLVLLRLLPTGSNRVQRLKRQSRAGLPEPEPEPVGAGVFGRSRSRSRNFHPAPAPATLVTTVHIFLGCTV